MRENCVMDATKEEVMRQLSNVLTIIPKNYIDALLTLQAKLEDKSVEWVVGGDLGEELRTIDVHPDCIEILTSKDGALKIATAVKEFNPSEISLEIQELSRNAKVNEKEYPVYARSYYFDFNIGTTKVKVYGNIQYRIDSWDWGDKLSFTPEYVYLVGKKIAVIPLSFKYEFYQLLGWTDNAERVKQALDKQHFHRR